METLGLIFNFVGSLIIALSVIKHVGEAHNTINGKKIYMASILLDQFRWGVIIMVVGFLLQILPKVL